MKILKYGLIFLILLGSCNRTVKQERTDSTPAVQKKKNAPELTPGQVVAQFYSWYLNNQKAASFQIRLETEKKAHWEYQPENYLRKLRSSGYVSDVFLDSLKEGVKKCNEVYRKQHPALSKPCGFEYDAVTGEYEPQKLDTVHILSIEQAEKHAHVLAERYYAYGKAAGKIRIILKKQGSKWLISGIFPDRFFQPAHASPVLSIPKSLKDKLLGRHKLSLQWISWDIFGEATFYEKDEVIHLEGRQSVPGSTDYLLLEGVVDILDEKQFRFTGRIVTQVTHLNGGKPCERKGTFTFAAKGQRKYWRMQEMTNPCDAVVDYVDVYF